MCPKNDSGLTASCLTGYGLFRASWEARAGGRDYGIATSTAGGCGKRRAVRDRTGRLAYFGVAWHGGLSQPSGCLARSRAGRAVKSPRRPKRAKEPLPLNHPDVTLRLLLLGSEQIAQRLRMLIATVGPSTQASQFYTHVRAKTADSINEKIVRKQRGSEDDEPKPYYSFRNLTDAVGMRIVTLYDDDLLSALRCIRDIVEAGQNLPDPLFRRGFVWDCFHDANFIKRDATPGDPYATCLRALRKMVADACNEYNKSIESDEPDHQTAAGGGQPRRTFRRPDDILNDAKCKDQVREKDKYSSAHVTFRALSYIDNDIIEIPVEFQLRTSVEDVWAEISHKLLYKSKPKYVWSREFEANYDNAMTLSKTLKDEINKLPTAINGLSVRARVARTNVDQFWPEDALEFNRRFQFSIVISWFFALDRDIRPYILLVEDYRRLILAAKAAQQSGHKDQARGSILAALATLDQIKRVVMGRRDRLVADVASRGSGTATTANLSQPPALHEEEFAGTKEECFDLKLLKECLGLCELERIRLRVFLAVLYDCRVSEINQGTLFDVKPDDAPQIKAHKKSLGQQTLMALYVDLCRYLDQCVALYPRCMTLFFKYYVSVYLNNPLQDYLTRKNLMESYALLDEDGTIPTWSIYRVLVPRHMVNIHFGEAQSMLRQITEFGSDGALHGMRSMERDVQEGLLTALRYALRVADEHDDGQTEDSGDLLFGFNPKERLIDLGTIVDITATYRQYFADFHSRILPKVKDQMKAHLSGLLTFLGNSKAELDLHTRTTEILEFLSATHDTSQTGGKNGEQTR